MLKALRQKGEARRAARALAAGLMERARQSAFFREFSVPDSLDGRFDLLAFHAWLVLDQCASEPALAQAVIDELFLHFDEALREMGTGDIGMNRRLKTLAGAFYGRLQAYRAAVDSIALTAAIDRNLYRGAAERTREASALATYAQSARSHLAASRLTQGELDFGPLPTM